jgi:type IV secretory pathway VirB2 component (pilin)
MFTKVETVKWADFFGKDDEVLTKKTGNPIVNKAAKIGGTAHLLLMPTTAFAAEVAGEATFLNVLATALSIADYLCVGIIIFAGTTWMFGNRTKAIEFITGGAIGYIIIRHAVDIRNWLRAL